MEKIRVTVSGSFRRHMDAIAKAINELKSNGVSILSPKDPTIVDQIDSFLFVASDLHRSIKLVQDRHFACIANSHFLWLVAPGGYVGQSASLEIGYALAHGIPIFSCDLPDDLTLSQYICQVHDIKAAIRSVQDQNATQVHKESYLIDPVFAVEQAHRVLEDLERILKTPNLDKNSELFRAAIGKYEELNKYKFLPTITKQ